jgi:hypothetical protein
VTWRGCCRLAGGGSRSRSGACAASPAALRISRRDGAIGGYRPRCPAAARSYAFAVGLALAHVPGLWRCAIAAAVGQTGLVLAAQYSGVSILLCMSCRSGLGRTWTRTWFSISERSRPEAQDRAAGQLHWVQADCTGRSVVRLRLHHDGATVAVGFTHSIWLGPAPGAVAAAEAPGEKRSNFSCRPP